MDLGDGEFRGENTEQMVPCKHVVLGVGVGWAGGMCRRDFSCVSGRHNTSVIGGGRGRVACIYKGVISFFCLFFFKLEKKMGKGGIPNVFHRCGPIYTQLGRTNKLDGRTIWYF